MPFKRDPENFVFAVHLANSCAMKIADLETFKQDHETRSLGMFLLLFFVVCGIFIVSVHFKIYLVYFG